MTKQELARWGADYKRKLDHKNTIEKIRRDGDAKIREIRKGFADLRRREEALSFKVLKDRVRWASEDAKAGRKAFPLQLATKWHLIHCEEAGVTPPDEVDLVPVWRQHAEETTRELGIAVEWVDIPGNVNAYAWPTLKRQECGPIRSSFGYASFRHEAGHNANPCKPTHRRVTTDEKKTVCVRCELEAWRWAIAGARPRWTRGMHDCLAVSLPSYRQYATPEEVREIDGMASDLGFRYIQLEQLGRTV